jgi:arylsulfatase A-like enzyme/Flp pilus assembly protein TadD
VALRRFRGGLLLAALLSALLVALFAAAGCAPRGVEHPSVLLVTLDTTRADRLGAYGAATGATPYLDAFARRGIVFDRAYAVAPMTLPAHATLLTGQLPPRTGLRWNGERKMAAGIPTLAEQFRHAGYSTAAFVSAAVLDSAFGLDRGFEVYDDEVGGGGPFTAERRGVETVARARAWLARSTPPPKGRPVFLWVHLFEPHDPYAPPAPFGERFSGDPYTGEVAAMDAALAPLLEEPRFSTAHAVAAVLGDHGESLGEHGEATHGLLVHEAALRVPFLLVAPGLAPGRADAEVSQADLAPTLAALAGLEPAAGIDGATLVERSGTGFELRAERAGALYAESLYGRHVYGWAQLQSARRDGWKLVRGASQRLFDTGADPGEGNDVAATEGARVGALSRALDGFAALEAAPGEGAAAVDAALAARLGSLGYLTGQIESAGGGDRSGPDPYARVAVHEKFRALDAALKRGEIERVRAGLREILAEDPGNTFAARVLEDQLRTALRAAGDPDTTLRLRLPLAQLLAQTGRRDEALAELAAVADTSAASAPARSARAFARLELGRAAEARSDWEALAREQPADSSPRLNLASLALAERRFADAERWAREAVELAPESAGARNSLGIALEELGRRGEAEREYEAALAADPAHVGAELNLALLRGARGDLVAAKAGLERVLARSPREPLALWTLGRLLLSEGDRVRGVGLLRDFVATAPRHPKAGEARALLAGLGEG